MDLRTPTSDAPKPRFRPWWVLFLLLLVASITYLVVRDVPQDKPAVPSPNFKDANEGL
jgi:hypothetical protein